MSFTPEGYTSAPSLPQPVPSSEPAADIDPYGTADQIVLNRYAPAGVVVNAQLEILQFRGQTGAYLEPSPGRASLNLLSMAKENLRLDLRTILYQARQLDQVVERETVALRDGDRTRRVHIEVVPFKVGDQAPPPTIWCCFRRFRWLPQTRLNRLPPPTRSSQSPPHYCRKRPLPAGKPATPG